MEWQFAMSFNETMEVLYTTDADNLDPKTYQVAKETFTVNDKAWEQYTAELPAGAKHFALHRNSLKREYTNNEDMGVTVEIPGTGSYIMMIDDIEFKIEAKTVTGYNVYKNGQKVETLAAEKTSYGPVAAADADVFYVTAVYADGESEASNLYSISGVAAIEAIEYNRETRNNGFFDLNGRAVKGQLRPGIYIVKKDGKSHKVVIK